MRTNSYTSLWETITDDNIRLSSRTRALNNVGSSFCARVRCIQRCHLQPRARHLSFFFPFFLLHKLVRARRVVAERELSVVNDGTRAVTPRVVRLARDPWLERDPPVRRLSSLRETKGKEAAPLLHPSFCASRALCGQLRVPRGSLAVKQSLYLGAGSRGAI